MAPAWRSDRSSCSPRTSTARAGCAAAPLPSGSAGSAVRTRASLPTRRRGGGRTRARSMSWQSSRFDEGTGRGDAALDLPFENVAGAWRLADAVGDEEERAARLALAGEDRAADRVQLRIEAPAVVAAQREVALVQRQNPVGEEREQRLGDDEVVAGQDDPIDLERHQDLRGL